MTLNKEQRPEDDRSHSPEELRSGGAFLDLGLSEWIVEKVVQKGYETPTPIQAQCLPFLLAGRDLIGQAQTGTGKTAAFSLPLIQRLPKGADRPPSPSALVLAPTRELAIQVADAISEYGGAGIAKRVCLLYGGQPIGPQFASLKRNPAVVVGTPGRVLDHVQRGSLDLSAIQFVVLDEADEMLKMGFIDDVGEILSHTPDQRQIALFSATMPREIQRIAERFLNADRCEIKIEASRRTSEDVEQFLLYAPREGKVAGLAALLELHSVGVRIIFARTRQATNELVDALARFGHQAEALNGEMGQQQREAVVKRLRDQTINTLVATDVAARGLDLDDVSLVVNFDLPFDSESYIHRIGRTGRAGQTGRAISIIEPRDKRALFHLERNLSQHIPIHPPIYPQDLLKARRDAVKVKIMKRMDQLEASKTRASDAEKFIETNPYHEVIYDLLSEGVNLVDLAAAALALSSGARPLELSKLPIRHNPEIPTARQERKQRRRAERDDQRSDSRENERREPRKQGHKQERYPSPMTVLQLNVGFKDGAGPRDLVGAITNEAGVSGQAIGAIRISSRRSLVEVQSDLSQHIIEQLNGRYVCNVQVRPEISNSPIGPPPPQDSHREKGGARPRIRQSAESKPQRGSKTPHRKRRGAQ